MVKKQYTNYSVKIQKKNNHLFSKNIVGLQNLKFDYISMTQIESVRKLLVRKLKKVVTIVIKMHCLLPITKKATGVRMGKGSGAIDSFIFFLKPGVLFLEFFNLEIKLFKKVLRQLQKKFKLRCFLVKRNFFF
jgi:large subunit ribosomal protein L16